uniref:Uncharacterized protein n=1 Tax=Panagrolaimus sp. PS1159 TaxID=55785 RepID=A0AC35FI12_9BILA
MGNCLKRESTIPPSTNERHPQFVDNEQIQRKIKKQKMKRAGTGYPGKQRKKRKNRTGHSPGWTSSTNNNQNPKNYDIFFIEHSEEPIPLERAL